MPFTIRPFRRFPVQYAATYNAGPFISISVLCLLIFLLPLSSVASGKTLTAVCKEPKGRVIGIEGKSRGNKSVDEQEGMRRGQFTLIWETGKDEAQGVIQGADGGPPLNEKAIHIHSSADFDTFLVTYQYVVWLYSIFPKANRLLMTTHTNGYFLDTDGALAKSMEARCEIGLK